MRQDSRGLASLNPMRLLAGSFASPGRLQLASALVDRPLPPREHVIGRDVAGGAVQTKVVVVVNVTLHQPARDPNELLEALQAPL